MPKRFVACPSPVHQAFSSSAETHPDIIQSSRAPSISASLLHERATPSNQNFENQTPQNTVKFTASKDNLSRISSAVGLIVGDINRVYPCLAKVPHYLSIKKYFKDNVRDRIRRVVTDETLATTTQVYNLYRNSYNVKSDLQQLFEICRTHFEEYTMPPYGSPGRDANLSSENGSELTLVRSTRTVGRIMSAVMKIITETRKREEVKLTNLQQTVAILEIRDRFYQILMDKPVPKNLRQLLTLYYAHYDLASNVQLLRDVSQLQKNHTAQEAEKENPSQMNKENLTVQNIALNDTMYAYVHKTTELEQQRNESIAHCSRDKMTPTLQVNANKNLNNNVTHEMELNEESSHQCLTTHADISTPLMRQCDKGQTAFEKPSENLFSGPGSISNTIMTRINSVIDKIVNDMINDYPETQDSHDYFRFIVHNRICKIIMNKPVPNYRELLILYREYHDSASDSQLIVDFYAHKNPSSLSLPSLQPHLEVTSTELNCQSSSGCSITHIEQITSSLACQSSVSDKYSVHRVNTTSQMQPTSVKLEGTTFNGPESASYAILNQIMKATLKIVHSMHSNYPGLPDLQLMYLRWTVRDRIYKIITGKPLPKYRELFTFYRAHHDFGSDEQLIRDIFARKQEFVEPPNWPVTSEVEKIDAVQSKILDELRDKYPDLFEFNNVLLRWVVRDRFYKLFKNKQLPVQNMMLEIYRKHYSVLSDERLLRNILKGKDINCLNTETDTTLKKCAQTEKDVRYCQIVKKVHEILDKKLDPIFNKLFQIIKSSEGIFSTNIIQESSFDVHLQDANITKKPSPSQVTPANEKLPNLQSTKDIHIIDPETENVQDVGIISVANSSVNFYKSKEKKKKLTESADSRKNFTPTKFAIMSERQQIVGDSMLDGGTVDIKETIDKSIDFSEIKEETMMKESVTDSKHIKPINNATNWKEENVCQRVKTDKTSHNYVTNMEVCATDFNEQKQQRDNSNPDWTCDVPHIPITEISDLRYSECITMIEETVNLKELNSIEIQSESQQSKPPELTPVTEKNLIEFEKSCHQHEYLADANDQPCEKIEDESMEDAVLVRIVHRIMEERLHTILPSVKNIFASLVAEDEELLTSFGLNSSPNADESRWQCC